MSTFLTNIKYALRQLKRSQGFSLTVILILALGIGANTAIFSLIHATLLRPLPFDEPERLVMIWQTDLEDKDDRCRVSYPNIEDWRRECPAFEGIAAYSLWGLTFSGEEYPMMLNGVCASANLFDLLRVKPLLGRTFTPEEEAQRLNDRVVLSYHFWKQHCQANPDIVGTTLHLEDTPYTVIGVLPDIRFPGEDLGPAQIWTLITEQSVFFHQRGAHCFQTYARLRPDVSMEQAQTQLDTIAARLTQEHEANADMGARITPLHSDLVRNVRSLLWILFGAVGLVLLIACTNTVNLMLIRANARTQELAIRAALGAGRVRLIGQALTESLLLTLISSLAALFVARGCLQFFMAIVPPGVSNIHNVTLNSSVIVFTLAITAVTGIAVGLIPMLSHSGGQSFTLLKDSSRSSTGSRHQRLRTVLATCQISVSMVLLVGSTLLLHSFWDLIHVNPGFQADHLLTWETSLPDKIEDERSTFTRLIENTKSLAGIRSLGATTTLPFADHVGVGIKRLNGPPSLRDKWLSTRYNAVTPDYFTTLGIPLRQGRFFTEKDTTGTIGAIVINETLARLYFSNENPLGQSIHNALRTNDDNPSTYEIVGVVADAKQDGFDQDIKPEIFVPYTQQTWNTMVFTARVQGDPLALVQAIRQTTSDVDKSILLDRFKTMKQVQIETVADRRFMMLLVTPFAVLALGLTLVGVYGVIAYSAAQRTREIGIRMALGADKANVTALILKHGIRIAVVGITLGTFAALLLCRFLQSMLFSITATDPLTYASVAVLLFCTTLLACYMPALRTAKVDPMEALRCE